MAVALLIAGIVFAAGGVAALTIGLLFAGWLYAQLPPVVIDVAAVGGAATATGVVLLLLGLVHGVAAALVARRDPRAMTPVVVLCATMSLLTLGWAAAALVSAASGSAPVLAMLPAGLGLVAVAIGYAVITRAAIRLRPPPQARG